MQNIIFSLILIVCIETTHSIPLTGSYPSFGLTSIPANYTTEWYSQKVDHFGYANQDHFRQRYIISTDHWCDGCPIFFYTGNEGDVMMFVTNTGFMWENAKQFKAMVVFAEHRYYGQSIPYGKFNQNLTELGYLTSEQALADYAELIMYFKESMPFAKNSPVIAFGGSYGGMLSAWIRIKYPHLVQGSLASAAPILFPEHNDSNSYLKAVTNDFSEYSINCSQSVRKSWSAVRRVAETEDGLKWLSETFAFCEPLAANETHVLINWLHWTWQWLATVDYANPHHFVQPLPTYPLKESCKYLTNPYQEDRGLIEDISKAVSVFYNYTGGTQYNDIYKTAEGFGFDQWAFQGCSELSMGIGSNGETDMFEPFLWNSTRFSKYCYGKYGVFSDMNKVSMMYGRERDISRTASNIIFSNGMRDPVSYSGCVLQSLSPTLISINIAHAVHHEDLIFEGPNDYQEVKDARNQEISIIKSWISEYYSENGFLNMISNDI